ncbi:hypothetical protein ASE00_08480 [Sphingomonas sp. Root710]|uniref:hypothetical protein n=1 Tax=Sphingomonas sp. Root710 TaxID=1736594 RepID=UPI0006F4D8F8|nr:hypothetical protein [Sphingomonas sp. Root710]KRB86707.1 hypothetical protein ASE00_08480 [Sphingomonas sp. Root710]
MAIIYVHGVKVRSPDHGIALGKSFQRWLAPKLSVGGTAPDYEPVYWGDLAATFHWNLASRPRTALLGMGGADDFAGLGSLRGASDVKLFDRSPVAPIAAGPVLGAAMVPEQEPVAPLSAVPREKRPDFLADLYLACFPAGSRDPIVDDPELAALADAAAAVADQWDSIAAHEADDAARARKLVARVDEALKGGTLIGMGGFAGWMEKAGEVVRRATTWPGDAVSTVLGEARPVMNEFVAYFVGDVFTYLTRRVDQGAPGPIPSRMLAALRRAQERKKATGEKIVVVSHSMGGQLVYDALAHFAAGDPVLDDFEVDHWITCGSQVSLFAEMQLFLGQALPLEGGKLAKPPRVKAWTNYYDRNDLVGFIMEPVFDDVKDQAYDTGYGLFFAHTGFLARPSFFKAIADRL